MPAIGFLLVIAAGIPLNPTIPPEILSRIFLRLILPLTIGLPLSYVVLLRLSKRINSMELETPQERIPVFIATLFFYATAYVFLRTMIVLPEIYYSMLFGAMLSVFIVTIITKYWKISIHATGVFGVVGALMAFTEFATSNFIGIDTDGLFWTNINVILLAGAVCSARLALNAHTAGQVAAGALLGFTVLYLPVRFGWFL